MNHFLYVKDDLKGDDPVPFRLHEYEEPDGGRLLVPSVLAQLELVTMQEFEENLKAWVAVESNPVTGLSMVKYKANSPLEPLLVKGKAVPQAATLPAGLARSLLRAAMLAVGGLMCNNLPIGTCVFVEQGYVLTCRHCILDGTRCLSGLAAFGHPLRFRAASPRLDLVLFTFGTSQQLSLKQPTPEQASLKQLASQQLPPEQQPSPLPFGDGFLKGDTVRLLSFPMTEQKTLHTHAQQQPVVSQGVVAVVGKSGCLAAADYSGCMPNSSGGAVVNDLGQLVGLHTGTCYHRDRLHGRASPPGSSGSHSSSSGTRRWMQVEMDAEKLSPVEGEGDAPEPDNVEHKAFLGLFVTGAAINQFIDAVDDSKDVLDVSLADSVKRDVKRLKKQHEQQQKQQQKQ